MGEQVKLPQNRFDIDEAKQGPPIRVGDKEFGGGPLPAEELVRKHNAEVIVRGAGSAAVERVSKEAAEYVGKNQPVYEARAKADMESDFAQRKAA